MAFAVSTVIGLAGLGLAGASAYMNYSAASEARDAQEANLAVQQDYARRKNESALKVQADNLEALTAQQNVEETSQKQMNLDATRRQRDIIRTSAAARAQALVSETAAGATGAGSSAVGGIEGNISGRSGVNLLGVFQNRDAGNAIFGFHQDQLNAYKKAAVDGYVEAPVGVADTSGTTAALGAGLGSFGSVLGKSGDTLGKTFNYFTGNSGIGDPLGGFGGSSSWSIGGWG